ncbi:Ig-like domain-containing protein (plasmid) [Streptomyces sp. NBC_01003]|uniref:Ig-like domain-containing protein n=1 Tax=Streptomyces sp. NBC_01003 TaxID=2903714 RepID=UPI002F90689C|nr:Ig-like domain-containing protein [Streptomyces sp. NBC_01003]
MRITPRRTRLVVTTALAAVLGLASPAWAAGSSTTVTATPQSTQVGATVQLAATVDCPADPTGGLGVTFFDNNVELKTMDVNANGQVSISATFSTPGTHTIIASYNGNTQCDHSDNSTTVQVTSAPTPPGPTPGFCLLACGGLINFSVGDINNSINIYKHG